MITREDDGLWINLEETINSHHEIVFACFTSGPTLSQWFPLSAEIDLRPGGTITFAWDASGTRTNTVTILDYDAGGKIVWDWLVATLDVHAPVYWQVEPSTEDGAVVKMRQGPFKESADLLMAMAAEAVQWQWLLCNLRCVLEAKHDMRRNRPL